MSHSPWNDFRWNPRFVTNGMPQPRKKRFGFFLFKKTFLKITDSVVKGKFRNRTYHCFRCWLIHMFFKSWRLTLMQANCSVEFFINLQIMNSMIFEPIFESFNFKNKLPELNKNPNCIRTILTSFLYQIQKLTQITLSYHHFQLWQPKV